MNGYLLAAFAIFLVGCAGGASLVAIGDSAWRVSGIDYVDTDAQRIASDQAKAFCAKRGQIPYVMKSRLTNDMPARYNASIEFQCMAGGTSPAALAEARLLGYQRDCYIAGYPLGTPQNMKCALEVSAKDNPKPGTSR
ncbi:MAG: hypothetical protein ABI607_01440 [Betaproteobacteria bacterium]